MYLSFPLMLSLSPSPDSSDVCPDKIHTEANNFCNSTSLHMSRPASPVRSVFSPIPSTSRLLQHTASTFIKSKDPSSPIHPGRESQTFHTLDRAGWTPSQRGRSPGGQEPSPSLRTNSPRCRNESYSKYFQGQGVADLFSDTSRSSSAQRDTDRGVLPPSGRPCSPTNASSERLLRKSVPHREAAMFGGEPMITRGGAHTITSSARPGLWMNHEATTEHAAFTGSRRHFREMQHTSVTGQGNMSSVSISRASISAAPSTPHSPLGQSGSYPVPVYSQFSAFGGSDLCRGDLPLTSTASSVQFGEVAALGKKIIPVVKNLDGSSCAVVGATQEGPMKGGRAMEKDKFHRRSSAPFALHVMEEVSSAPTNAPNPRSNNILAYSESGWGSAAVRREKGAVSGQTGRADSLSQTNLRQVAAEAPAPHYTIRTMQGPPPFVPAPFSPRSSSTGKRCSSPGRSSLSQIPLGGNAPSVVAALSSMPAPQSSSPVRSGRAAGMYSPTRRSSIVF